MTSWIALATVATFPSFSPAMEMRPSRVRKIACSDVSLDQFAEIFSEIDRARELRRRDRAAHLGRSRAISPVAHLGAHAGEGEHADLVGHVAPIVFRPAPSLGGEEVTLTDRRWHECMTMK